jgi:hypothetical protein
VIFPRLCGEGKPRVNVLLEGSASARRVYLANLEAGAKEWHEAVLRLDLTSVADDARAEAATNAASRCRWDLLLVDGISSGDADTMCWLAAIAPPGAVFGIACDVDELTSVEGVSVERLCQNIHGVVSV